MNSPERPTHKPQELTWSYDTPYDVPELHAWTETEGESSQRVIDIKNYIHYINNEMPEDYKVVVSLRISYQYDPLYAYGYNTRAIRPTWLYRQSETGEFVMFKIVEDSAEFMGDKIMVRENAVYVVDTNHGIGIKPEKAAVKMVYTGEDMDVGYDGNRRYKFQSEKLANLLRAEKPIEDYLWD